MQNVKYHIMTSIAVIFFSYILATSINEIIKFTIPVSYNIQNRARAVHHSAIAGKGFDYYKDILESGFFRIADLTVSPLTETSAIGSSDDLTLLGTITGPEIIARAMIQKKGEKNPGIFALYYINSEITNDVYGYKLIGIHSSSVYLKNGSEKITISLFDKKEHGGARNPASSGSDEKIRQSISRAEIKQQVFSNMDNALKGLMAGPNRVGDRIDGYRIIQIRPDSILFRLGARPGDVVRRVNGRALDSTEKLYSMWETLKNESKIAVDIERAGKIISYDFNITD